MVGRRLVVAVVGLVALLAATVGAAHGYDLPPTSTTSPANVASTTAGVNPASTGSSGVERVAFRSLVAAEEPAYPNKAGRIEYHHVVPKYLGGDPDGELIPLDGSYHQEITNAFRQEYPYGQPPPSPEDLQGIMKRVYGKYPLP